MRRASALVAAFVVAIGSFVVYQATPVAAAASVTKMIVFVEENHSYAEMQAQMPFLWSQSTTYSYATNYTGITHPSQPNYLAITGGSTFGLTSDINPAPQFAGQSVFGQAIAAGHNARQYAESMPSNCYQSRSGDYSVSHSPWPSYKDERSLCNAYAVPMGTDSSGVMHSDVVNGTLPTVALAVPNNCNNAHNCSLGTADAWLKRWVQLIQLSPDFQAGRLLIVITADEDDGSQGNKVLTTVIHPSLRGRGAVTTSLNHYSLSGLMSQISGSSPLRNAATAPSFANAFGIQPK